MPQQGDAVAGAHNIVLDSWNDDTARFGFGNSWSERWGAGGFGSVPYEHVARFGFDLWAVRVVESPGPAPIKHNALFVNTAGLADTMDDVANIKVDGKQVWP